MPIPGPPFPSAAAAAVAPTGSPFWLCINEVWVQIEGVTPSTQVGVERRRSDSSSMSGRRFEQRARLARREWTWTLPYAAAAHLAAVSAAVESDYDVWLMSDAVAAANMLPPRSCFGDNLPAVDCGGVPLRWITPTTALSGRVRGGVPTTLSCWSDAAAGDDALSATYPGGSIVLESAGGGQVSATFTPASDGVLTITAQNGPTSGLMLTEADPAATWIAGESMPCKVAIDDPVGALTMFHRGAWRHDYSITLREVG